MDAIHLEDLSFFAYHGVYDEEAQLGQRFHVDLTCWLDLSKACESDDYEQTVCYGSLTKAVESAVTQTRFKLIERLAAAVSEALFEADPRIEKTRVRIHKPGAPLPIATGKVSVEITRDRPALS
ncbi:dihydroneopterin aldolase [Roseibium polysiphoniae]|uniref:7,8-dihydroneopterin aldolase n=1 Tax=Roseibium polysiphoniae TaxID=2571221 RepID=A0A944CCM9_9HYPH|nr:dihydroneopterin aldolase [Roseibium polysiphoniae]MBS8259985.1 dihydroneopterin aldolase [Roseibium polysiphoniae]